MKKCSFCGLEKPDNEIIEGLTGNICYECLETEKESIDAIHLNNMKLLKPHEIKKELDKYVIAQEDAKRKIAVEVYNHYKRISLKSKSVEFPKTNILMVGPSGSGKTYLIQRLSQILNVPLVIGDATEFTEAGYVGKDVETLLSDLIDKADGDISLAEKGIIYIDEIDKICTKNRDIVGKDVGGSGVQNSLLKIIEGMEYSFSKTDEVINTKNILFICGGAFDGLEKIIEKRIHKQKTIGFSSENTELNIEEKNNLFKKVTEEDLLNYGFVREFLGRLPMILSLEKLSEEDLKLILTKPKNAIVKQYTALLKADNVKLKFSKDAIDYIAKKAYEKGTGARALNGIISDKLNELMYEIPMKEDITEYTITKEFLEH